MTQRPINRSPRLVIRPITPDDKPALAAGLGRLSDQSVYQRFLSPKPRLTAADLRYLTEVDFADHYALVATPLRRPGEIVAVGRWVRDVQDPAQAEVAVVVADDLQGRGVGTQLGTDLARAARDHGVERFTATMLPSNTAAHRLFARLSEQLEQTRSHGIDELVAPLAPAA